MRDQAALSEGPESAVPEGRTPIGRPFVLVGGFPCQGLSVVGPTRDLVGQSALWYQFQRVIQNLKPDWVVVENVAHTWRKWVPVVRKELAGLGYHSLPLRVRASDLGAPHDRSRIWLVAHSDGESLRKLQGWWCGKGREVAAELGHAWHQEPSVPRMDDGTPDRVDRNHAIGNAACPQIAQIIARGIREVTVHGVSDG